MEKLSDTAPENRGGLRLGNGHLEEPAARFAKELEALDLEARVPGALPPLDQTATSLEDTHRVDSPVVAATGIDESSGQETGRAHAGESAPDLP